MGEVVLCQILFGVKLDTRRGEFNRQRQAVQAGADVGDGLGTGRSELEVGPERGQRRAPPPGNLPGLAPREGVSDRAAHGSAHRKCCCLLVAHALRFALSSGSLVLNISLEKNERDSPRMNPRGFPARLGMWGRASGRAARVPAS